jgi:thymidylate kinase
VASVSGKFGDDGSGKSTVTIKVAKSVEDGYYPLVLTTKAGQGERTFMLLVAAGEGGVAGG